MSSDRVTVTVLAPNTDDKGFALDTRTILTRAERNRVRAEFIKWIRSLPNPATINRDYFLDQLDRICPTTDHGAGEFPMITDDRNSDG